MRKTFLYGLLLVIVAVLPGLVSAQQPPVVNGGVLNGRATKLPMPQYPEIAKKVKPKPEGEVRVEITIDETGKVVSAKAVSGHELLLGASVDAARKAEFSPTTLKGQPVKVNGVIIYKFKAPE